MKPVAVAAIQSIAVALSCVLFALAISIQEGHGLLMNILFVAAGASVALFALSATSLFGSVVRLFGGHFQAPSRSVSLTFIAFCVMVVGSLVAIYLSRNLGGYLILGALAVGSFSVILGFMKFFSKGKK